MLTGVRPRLHTRMLLSVVVLVPIAAAVVWGLFEHRGQFKISGDDNENFSIVFNLLQNGTYSTEPHYVFWKSQGQIQPNMYREPLYPMMLYSALKITDGSTFRKFGDFLGSPAVANHVTLIQAFLLFAMFLLVFFSIYALSESALFSLIGAALFMLLIVLSGWGSFMITHFRSELLFSVLLLMIAFGSLQMHRNQGWGFALFTGLSFGSAALTKAIMFHVFPLFLLAYPLLVLWRDHASLRTLLLRMMILVIGFSLTVLPWLTRNAVTLGKFEMSSRGGLVVYSRAVHNDIASGKLAAAMYYYSNDTWKNILGTLLGIAPEMLRPGGRYHLLHFGLNPGGVERESVINGDPTSAPTYRSKIFAYYRQQLLSDNTNRPTSIVLHDVENKLRGEAVTKIFQAPLKHLITTPVFLWRGVNSSVLGQWLTPLVGFLFAMSYIGAIFIRSQEATAYLVFGMCPALGLGMYGFLTHFIARYGEPFIPVLYCAVSGSLILVAREFVFSRTVAARFHNPNS